MTTSLSLGAVREGLLTGVFVECEVDLLGERGALEATEVHRLNAF